MFAKMKYICISICTLLLITLLLICGCSPKFKNIKDLSIVQSAQFVSNRNDVSSRVIDLKPIASLLAEAEWHDATPINKGGCWLKVDGFPDIFVSDVNGCFWLTGYRGLYKINEDDIPRFYEYLYDDGSESNDE